MAARYNVDATKLYETLKNSIFPKATDGEMMALIVIANEYKLNVMLRELYAFPAKSGGVVPVVSVDGWNKMLLMQPDYDGIEFEFVDDESGKPYSCTVTIYVKNRSHPVKITEYLSECKRNTDPWNNMPRRMLRNRTLCQGARVAFGFSGVYHDEEVEAITVDSTVITTTTPLPLTEPPKTVVTSDSKTPQKELESLVVTAGFTFDHLRKWGEETGNITNADSLATFDEIDTAEAKRLLKAQAGLLKGLEQVKG
jgi:hypothetical protein